MPHRVTDGVTPSDIARVHEIIAPYIRRTPVLHVNGTDVGLGSFPLTLKLELTQHAGSFKARGAFANLLLRKPPAAGVVAASGGYHGAAVAYAAKQLGVPATIFVPDITSPAKAERIKGYGAKLVMAGSRYADALAASEAHVEKTGAMPIHAYDQTETLLGQGTVGLELERDMPDVGAVRSQNAPPTRMSGGPSPTVSNAIVVPSADRTFLMFMGDLAQ